MQGWAGLASRYLSPVGKDWRQDSGRAWKDALQSLARGSSAEEGVQPPPTVNGGESRCSGEVQKGNAIESSEDTKPSECSLCVGMWHTPRARLLRASAPCMSYIWNNALKKCAL